MQPYINMACDYYVDRCLFIEYISETGRYCTLTTDLSRQPKYIRTRGEYSSYQRKLERKIEKHTYREIIYKNNEWASSEHMTKYTYRLQREFPYIRQLKKMYLDFEAFRADYY